RVYKVTIHYRQRRVADWLTLWRNQLASIALNSAIPWEIEFHGGVASLNADLRTLGLCSLDLSDSSAVRLLLPQPTGTVFVYVSGSASDVVIQCPAGVARRVQIAGSAPPGTLPYRNFDPAGHQLCLVTSRGGWGCCDRGGTGGWRGNLQ